MLCLEKIICTPTCELKQNCKTSLKVCIPKPALGTDNDPWHARETTICMEICFPAVTPPKFPEPFGPRDEHQASACSRGSGAGAGRWLLGIPAAPALLLLLTYGKRPQDCSQHRHRHWHVLAQSMAQSSGQTLARPLLTRLCSKQNPACNTPCSQSAPATAQASRGAY